MNPTSVYVLLWPCGCPRSWAHARTGDDALRLILGGHGRDGLANGHVLTSLENTRALREMRPRMGRCQHKTPPKSAPS